MRPISWPIFIAATIATLLPSVWAQSCSPDAIKGSYGFISSAKTAATNGVPAGRYRYIGIIKYDGAEGATADGLVINPSNKENRVSMTGQYQLNGCVGRVVLKNSTGPQNIWMFVIVSGGSELLTLDELSPNTTPFVQKKQ